MAMRCSHCDINFPSDKTHCPGCKSELWHLGMEQKHDYDWKKQSDRIARRVKRDFKDRLPSVACTIVERDGQLFVADEILKDAGYLDLASGDIVKINDEYYECSSAVFYGLETPGWWISFIPVDGVFEDAESEAIWEDLTSCQQTQV